MSVLSQIASLHAEASAILRPVGRAPTRGEYACALELADRALDLAAAANLDGPAVSACEAFQRFCYAPLLRSYERIVGHERCVYDRSATRSSLKRRRVGRIFNTDPGEHLLEAFEAVRIGRLLDEQECEEAAEANRRIRWVDEVNNEAIQTVVGY
ncbi:hypothetical protein F4781DRAFT_388838 [Annulohypoxylon bovei var. microspora]|nr:hypothetical protein F4781DRAFT_388838 [Annulohypoxylon bovei var. microspora]